MSKRCYNPFTTLVLFGSTIAVVLFFSSLSFSASTYPVPQTAEVTLAWDPNDPAPDGYRIYQREEGASYDYGRPVWTGPHNSGTVYNLEQKTTYYYVVRAYAGNQESGDSKEVKFIKLTSLTVPEPGSNKDDIAGGQDEILAETNEWIDSDGDGIGDTKDPDDDNDGMPDSWEVIYGLDPLIDDAHLDLDVDGTDNFDEYINGSDPTAINDDPPIVIDDGQSGTSSTGSWTTSGGANPYGSRSLYSRQSGATYSYQSAISGVHDVELWWTTHASRCTDVPVKIYDGATLLDTVYVNQLEDGGQWNLVGTYDFKGQARAVIVSEDGGCSTSADAVAFSRADNVVMERAPQIIDDGQSGTSSSGSWSTSGGDNPYGSGSLYSKQAGAAYSYQLSTSGLHDVELWWTPHASRCADVPVKIYDGATLLETVTVNQQEDGGQWNFLGIYEFNGLARVVVVSEDGGCSTSADAVAFSRADNAVVERAPQIIDDGQSGTSSSGSWSTSGGDNPYGSGSLYSKQAGATYSYQLSTSGLHDVELWWTPHASRCTDVPVKIYDEATLLDTVYVNQLEDGGQWNLIGTYDFKGQARAVIVSDDGGCSTSADAVAFSRADNAVAEPAPQIIDDGQSGTSSSGSWSTSGGDNPYGYGSLYSKQAGATYSYQLSTSGQHDVELWWTPHASRCTDVPVKIYDEATLLDTVYVNQMEDGGQWNLIGTYDFKGQARAVIVSDDGGCSTSADAIRYSKR